MSGDRSWLLSCVPGSRGAGTTELLRHLKGQHAWRIQPVEASPASFPACGVLIAVSGRHLSDSVQWLAQWRQAAPHLPRLCVAFDIDQTQLASLLDAGADDFVVWPCNGVELAWRMRQLSPPGRAIQLPPPARPIAAPVPGFLYGCDACARVAARLPTLAASPASVLIFGETGTGKEVIAQALHYLSPRSCGPCVAVNCAVAPGICRTAERISGDDTICSTAFAELTTAAFISRMFTSPSMPSTRFRIFMTSDSRLPAPPPIAAISDGVVGTCGYSVTPGSSRGGVESIR